MDKDSTDDSRLLFGMAGWPHPEWEKGYFPDDLPPDWQFAYYSNDADSLLLSSRQFQALDPEEVADWLADVAEHFRFYLQWSGGELPGDLLQAVGAHLGGLLLENFQEADSEWPQFRQGERGYWVDREGVPRVRVLPVLPADLRQQRAILEQLPYGLGALLVADSSADPGCLADMRKVAELLGIA